ncbi:cupin domain-containing protein [Chloroflexota bacterium]
MIKVNDFRKVEAESVYEGVTMRQLIGPDDGAPIFNMRVLEVPSGQSTPYHSHWWEHEVFVLSGQGSVRTDQGDLSIEHGSTVLVPGSDMHQFKNTGDGMLRFICVVPQEWLHGIQKPGA